MEPRGLALSAHHAAGLERAVHVLVKGLDAVEGGSGEARQLWRRGWEDGAAVG